MWSHPSCQEKAFELERAAEALQGAGMFSFLFATESTAGAAWRAETNTGMSLVGLNLAAEVVSTEQSMRGQNPGIPHPVCPGGL